MNIKQTIGMLAVIIGIGLVAWGVANFTKPTGEVVTTSEEEKSLVLGGSATSSTAFEYIEDAPYYRIEATYPRKTMLANAEADVAARRTIEQGLLQVIEQFKDDGDFANLTTEDVQIQGLGPDRKYELGFSYREYKGANSVSYVFVVYQDTLGAHPNTYYLTYTFDETGKRLELGDMFKPGVEYLPKLSQLAYAGVLAELRKKMEVDPQSDMLDTVRMGTAPTPEALQFFYMDGNTLHLLFPPYQVAAYAAGSFDIAIPTAQITSILK